MFVFVETPLFTRLIQEYLTDDEYTELQAALVDRPDAGPVIPGSGGVRKLRWSLSGRGKRGGLRVIYYLKRSADEIWMLTVYPKTIADNIPPHIFKQILKEIENV